MHLCPSPVFPSFWHLKFRKVVGLVLLCLGGGGGVTMSSGGKQKLAARYFPSWFYFQMPNPPHSQKSSLLDSLEEENWTWL